MIPLELSAEIIGAETDFVCRVSGDDRQGEAELIWAGPGELVGLGDLRLRVAPSFTNRLIGDVLVVNPARGKVRRLLRADSQNNFFLVTEQCDQLCVMCSQPPKTSHHDRFWQFERAVELAPADCRIVITGGEPTLHKAALFDFLTRAYGRRRDVTFHVLSSAQHLDDKDGDFLTSLAGRSTSWGVPLYAADAATHDAIVGKDGAYARLMEGLALLGRTGASLELRTVVMTNNVLGLSRLARFIAANLPFVSTWAVMQLERAGFARNRWAQLFFDTSREFSEIGKALDVARAAGISAQLYNFPLCTIPAPYRRFAASSISDWKRKYLSSCDDCPVKAHCGGFFEWYPEASGFQELGFQ